MAENIAYDPYANRSVERPISSLAFITHLLKSCIGSGILALPLAFSYVGWIMAPMLVLIIAIFTIYCLNMLVKAIYSECQKREVPTMTYSVAMASVVEGGPKWMRGLSSAAGVSVDLFLLVEQEGTCSIYVVFIANHLKQIFDEHLINWDVRIWMAILYVPLLALAFIRDYKSLRYVSLIGNLVSCVALSCLLYFILTDLPSLAVREKFGNISKYPLFLSMVAFAIQPIAILMPLEHLMNKPHRLTGFCGVLCIPLAISTAVYICFGFVGYWKYGNELLGSISLNIPQDSLLALAIRIMYAWIITMTHPIQGMVSIEIIWHQHLRQKVSNTEHHTRYEILVRVLHVTITTLTAIAIPMLGSFIALIGALSLSVLGFMYPAVIDALVHYPDNMGYLKWILIKDVLIFLFGAIALVCGLYTSISDIVLKYKGVLVKSATIMNII